jgi:branched-chain amino acid transport system ATP-binding protein
MVSVAACLRAAPRLLFLDEPTLGLSPKLRAELAEALDAVRKTGLSMILIDQDVQFLTRLIDRICLFDHGSVGQEFARADVPNQSKLMALLFGQEEAV